MTEQSLEELVARGEGQQMAALQGRSAPDSEPRPPTCRKEGQGATEKGREMKELPTNHLPT